jgi:hypothetical protein
MKLKLLKIRTQSQLKRNKALRTSIPYKKASTVGLLFTVEDKPKHDKVKEFIRKLELDGKKVQVICYLPDKKENYEFLFDFFTAKDVSFWGNLESNNAAKFCNTEFDYLFCLDTKPHALILNILARSKAKCRIGKFTTNEQPYYEMMIDSNGSVSGLINGIYQYTAQLK